MIQKSATHCAMPVVGTWTMGSGFTAMPGECSTLSTLLPVPLQLQLISGTFAFER